MSVEARCSSPLSLRRGALHPFLGSRVGLPLRPKRPRAGMVVGGYVSGGLPGLDPTRQLVTDSCAFID